MIDLMSLHHREKEALKSTKDNSLESIVGTTEYSPNFFKLWENLATQVDECTASQCMHNYVCVFFEKDSFLLHNESMLVRNFINDESYQQ